MFVFLYLLLFYILCLCIDPPDLSIDPTAEQLKLFNEENHQLKSELDDINQKVDTLDTRNYSFLFCLYN